MISTMLEQYTADQIYSEIQSETSDDLSDVLARQRIKENPLKVFNE